MGKKEYHVVCEDDIDDLIENVQYFLDDGWCLQGGVSLSILRYSDKLCAQALVREAKEN